MSLLILGLILWILAHFFRRLAPGLRAALGERPGKMLVAAVVLASVVLMVIGYRRADIVPVYMPLPGMGHLNNLLMLGSVFLFGVPHSKGLVKSWLRHPMLIGVIVWAVAHLLVNGDLASLVLFGGIGAWALISIPLINASTEWRRPAPGGLRSDAIGLAISVVIFAVIAAIHIWLGHNPFLGTYA